jgi:uncharacterized protein YcsI (UPF0317 family)
LGRLVGPTAGLAAGFVQANLVALPRELAFDFLLFCQRNPKPCPLLEVVESGQVEAASLAPGSDLRTDLPAYRIWRDGQLVERTHDATSWWREDIVAFLLGCSFTFERALLAAGVPVRHLELGCNVPMFRTNVACKPAGVFHGPMVVSMRPMLPAQAIRAVEVTAHYPCVHGSPVHLGDPRSLGIDDLQRPDYGDPVEVRPGEIPVFWACGVTPQAVVVEARPSLAITHDPGHMFITDLRDADLHDA